MGAQVGVNGEIVRKARSVSVDDGDHEACTAKVLDDRRRRLEQVNHGHCRASREAKQRCAAELPAGHRGQRGIGEAWRLAVDQE